MCKQLKYSFAVNYIKMSDSNLIVILEAQIEELQTRINKLAREKEEQKQTILKIVSKYILNKEELDMCFKEIQSLK